MKSRLLIVVMFCSLSCFAQKPNKLTDSTTAVAIIKADDTYLCTFKDKSCQCITGRVLDKGSRLIISGARECNDIARENNKFFTVLFENVEYLIECPFVSISDTNFYTQLMSMTEDKKEAFRNHAFKVMNALNLMEQVKVAKFVKNAVAQGLFIENWSFYDESEYTNGTGIKFEVINTANKTIKYISFTLLGLNGVGDPVKGKLGANTITVKGVGPIEPHQSGSYDFEYAWLSDLIQEVKITSVKIQYMDNTFKVISNPQSVIITDYHRKILDEATKE